ncbi:MAG: hypothetical protein R2795_17165 [Saprospiraceae bacterium]
MDYDEWDPETDTFIPATYSVEDMRGKAVCKQALQEKFGLEVNARLPILGVVSRFLTKGLDVFYESILVCCAKCMQIVVLGSGDKALEGKYMELPTTYPRRVGTPI